MEDFLKKNKLTKSWLAYVLDVSRPTLNKYMDLYEQGQECKFTGLFNELLSLKTVGRDLQLDISSTIYRFMNEIIILESTIDIILTSVVKGLEGEYRAYYDYKIGNRIETGMIYFYPDTRSIICGDFLEKMLDLSLITTDFENDMITLGLKYYIKDVDQQDV